MIFDFLRFIGCKNDDIAPVMPDSSCVGCKTGLFAPDNITGDAIGNLSAILLR